MNSEVAVKLDLSVNDVNVVLAGLAELQAKNSYDVINKVKTQAEIQLANAPAPQLLTEDGSPAG